MATGIGSKGKKLSSSLARPVTEREVTAVAALAAMTEVQSHSCSRSNSATTFASQNLSGLSAHAISACPYAEGAAQKAAGAL